MRAWPLVIVFALAGCDPGGGTLVPARLPSVVEQQSTVASTGGAIGGKGKGDLSKVTRTTFRSSSIYSPPPAYRPPPTPPRRPPVHGL
ncbi:MAG TPA: hypothetical protein VGI39_09850 [Polyangiaceae bacterium]|jgi:hypothetical protein